MGTYKVIFANNEVISCKKVSDFAAFSSPYKYEQRQGKLIYALIKAESEQEATALAFMLILEISSRVLGSDYIL